MANELKKALFAAKNDEEWGTLSRNKVGQFKYADLTHILRIVEPPLKKYGLMLSFEPKVRDGIEIMITVLTHVESGESTTAESVVVFGKDTKSWGGCKTYMKRYGILDVLGIAVTDDYDPDSDRPITPEQATKIKEALTACGDKKREAYTALLKEGQVASIEEILQDGFKEVMKFIEQFKPR